MIITLIILFILITAGIIYLPSIIGLILGYIAFIGIFLWRMLQSFWKQKLWAIPLWAIAGIPFIFILLYADHSLMVWEIFAAWTFFIASIATIICYRDGRSLRQAP